MAAASPTDVAATPEPTEVSATATSIREATRIAPADLTLTAIRETVSAAASPTGDLATLAPTEVALTTTLIPKATRIAPANLTSTAIHEPVSAPVDVATASALSAENRTPSTGTPTAIASLLTATATAADSPVVVEMRSPTPSQTSAVTPTETPLPFYFAYLIPTPTAYGTSEVAIRLDCEVEEDWLSYEVQVGDTLLALALASDISLIELREGNCFEPIRGIFAGEALRVPRMPARPVETPAPVFLPPELVSAAFGCEHAMAEIHSPQPMDQVQDIFAIIGNVQLPEKGKYQLAIKPDWSNVYYPYLESDKVVQRDVIGLINTEIFGAGSHRLRLTVSNSAGEMLPGGLCDMPLVFGRP